MYRRISGVLFPITTILMIGAFVWGYQVNQQKNSIQIKSENEYQRSFHDLAYHVNSLHGELGNTLAVHTDSSQMHRKGLMNVWRMTSEAQNEITHLPLGHLPFNQTEALLSRLSSFSYQTANRDLTNEPLTEKELGNLRELYKSTGEINNNLQQVQSKVLANNLHWTDVETALDTNKMPTDNAIVDGFREVDKRVGQYPELDLGPSVPSMKSQSDIKKLNGPIVSASDIQMKAAKFLGFSNSSVLKVTENGAGTKWASFTASTDVNRNGVNSELTIDYTRQGGELISYRDTRVIGARSISSSSARSKADYFLRNKGYLSMTPVTYREYQNTGTFTYVRSDGGALVYPEKIIVRVALDNGEVTGIGCSDYVYERAVLKTLPKPKLTLQEARKHLNPKFKESYHRQAVIKDHASKLISAYEFGGVIHGTKYRIFLNGDNGDEENIEEITQSSSTQEL